MQDYTVTWEIQLSANSPLQAARMAQVIQRDPQSLATCFTCIDEEGEATAVDLMEGSA